MSALRPLAAIAADALAVSCGHCWADPGQQCAESTPGAMHLARFARCRRRGLISDADMCTVLDVAAPGPLDVFTPATVIFPEAVAA
jgi:hypothetical protein